MYGKIFESIYTGSLYGRLEATCMMQALIVFADQDGFIDMSFPVIVARTGYPREFVLKGMTELMQPDPISRTEGEEGRRIGPVTPCHAQSPEGVNGFYLVNHGKYSSLAKQNDVREQNRLRKQKSRKKHGENSNVTPQSRSVTKCPPLDIDIDVDVDVDKRERERIGIGRFGCSIKIPENLAANEHALELVNRWAEISWLAGQVQPLTFEAQVCDLAKRGPEATIEILERSIRDGAKTKPFWEPMTAGPTRARKKSNWREEFLAKGDD